MRNVDYIIVGDGYAALFFAHQLIQSNKSFVLFSNGKKSASQVSAGIVNPMVLKKFTTFWLAQEQLDRLNETLDEIEKYTGNHYLIKENIHRIFHDQKEKELWLSKSENPDLKPFLNLEFKTLETIKNPFGVASVDQSARLNVEGFFNDFKHYLKTNDFLIQENFNYDSLNDHSYGDISFKNIVFCEGIGVKNNPFFSEIPVIPNKGHHLKVRLSEKLNHQLTLKKKHFLFPLNEEFYYYGGTYDPNFRSEEIDEFKKEELITGLQEFYPHDFQVEEVNFGFRPTVKDRRPILGNHPKHQNFYMFNGLGARGILNGCYFAKELFQHIEFEQPLIPEVDLKRFNLEQN
ncbi:NAD(P)/FAD-dependent oxidoreductase [Kaistella montana]|uniref:NAD(P)/FAD-dependent oxidoreductase n=1 Tax=Kaistella montana TaxID=1849733 RepID=A0ABW5K597_9FLAO|nr:FAD-dependent oxidoreductase [Kaistella montana]MCQ4034303.1 FAD-dependent oxidoreductase [Kaistella montana]